MFAEWLNKFAEWPTKLWVLTNTHSSVQSLSHVRLFATPWSAARQASLSITNSQSLPKVMSIESVMASSYLILCCLLLLLPSIFPSISVFSNESTLCVRWPKYWSFSFSISPSKNSQGWFPSGLTHLISLLSKSLSPSQQFKSIHSWHSDFFMIQLSCPYFFPKLENHSFD